MRVLNLFAAAALVVAPGIAQAAQAPQCLTAAEFTAMTTYGLPSMIRGTSQRCATVLPADAYLRRDGERLAARYERGKNAAWPAARAAFLRVGSNGNAAQASLMQRLPDDTLRPLVDELILGMVDQKLPTDRCKAIDRVVALLAPLPAENTAELIGLAAGLGAATGKARTGQFQLCEAS